MKRCIHHVFLSLVAVAVASNIGIGQEEATLDLPPDPKEANQELYDAFSKKMSNSALVGHFTIDGQSAELKEERYELKGVTKLPNGDYWLFKARIRYGDHDVTVPLPLQVKWAAKTPVITLDNVTIPGLGTFDARVLIDGDRYAGTWQHGEVGGLLFGRVETGEKDNKSESPEATEEKADE